MAITCGEEFMQVLELTTSQIELLNFLSRKARQFPDLKISYTHLLEHVQQMKGLFKRYRLTQDLNALVHLGIVEEYEERHLHVHFRISEQYRHYFPFHYKQ